MSPSLSTQNLPTRHQVYITQKTQNSLPQPTVPSPEDLSVRTPSESVVSKWYTNPFEKKKFQSSFLIYIYIF
jgi:hypothetical protein